MTLRNDKEDMVFNTIKGFAGLDRNLAWEISRFLVEIGMVRDPIESPEEAALGEAEEKLRRIRGFADAMEKESPNGIGMHLARQIRMTLGENEG